MVATTTPPTKTFRQIVRQFPAYTFKPGEFKWSPTSQTIFYKPPRTLEDLWSLLHELAHAELGHTTFGLDIELIQYEGEAWNCAAQLLAPRFGLDIDPNYIEDHLDTYRGWLFKRSLCPNCTQTGIQTTKNTYSCINCRCLWRTNEARTCALRRTRLQGQGQIF